MNKPLKIIRLLALVVLSSCIKDPDDKDDYLTIPKTPFLDSSLRTDGFYYQKWENETKFNKVTFLYRDGVVLDVGGSGDLLGLNDYLKGLSSNNFSSHKTFWGAFLVHNQEIVYERWASSELGNFVYREEGQIVNDSTFTITSVSRIKKGVKMDARSVEWTYHFKAFSPKIDSTNRFVK